VSAIATYIKGRRWFRAKARGLASATVDETFTVRLAGEDVAFSIVLCKYEDGETDRYVVPMATATGAEAVRLRSERPQVVIGDAARPALGGSAPTTDRSHVDGGVIYDALGSERLLGALLDQFRGDGLRVKSDKGQSTLVFRAYPALASAKPANVAPRLMTSEQTNTSVLYGDAFILKVVRKLDEGTSAELEMGEVLTRQGYASAPPVMGAIELESGPSSRSTVGILHRQVVNRGDAWGATLKELSAQRGEAGGKSLADAALLGRRVGEMHVVLAGATEPAFAPEPIRREHRQKLAAALGREAQAVERFLRNGDLARILARLDAFVDQDEDPIAMRIHGDLHLGQILATEDDFVIIDFEGEPSRSLAERKAKRSPLADVAGMLRSFDYAAATVLRPTSPAAARAWHAKACDAFIRAYRAATQGSRTLTLSPDAWRKSLDFFLVEKSIYEVGYEANNRPDWIRIPQEGIADLLDGTQT